MGIHIYLTFAIDRRINILTAPNNIIKRMETEKVESRIFALKKREKEN